MFVAGHALSRHRCFNTCNHNQMAVNLLISIRTWNQQLAAISTDLSLFSLQALVQMFVAGHAQSRHRCFDTYNHKSMAVHLLISLHNWNLAVGCNIDRSIAESTHCRLIVVLILVIKNRWQYNLFWPSYISELLIYIRMFVITHSI